MEHKVVVDRLLTQVSPKVREYYDQYRYIKENEHRWDKFRAHNEHARRFGLHKSLNDVERAQSWLIIVADEHTCPVSLLPSSK